MIGSDLAADLARLFVILVAAIAAVPLVKRASDRRSTGVAIASGMGLTLLPSVLHMLAAVKLCQLPAALAVLGRLDAPGLALILYGVVLSLRNVSRKGEELQKQNLALREEASTDFLTGLLNRRQADLLLEYGAARARRSGDPLGFIMLDLDHFKNVNDTHGHRAGDQVLRQVAALLKSRMRASDIVARYGGEEFLLVLADATREGIVALADDLRRLIEQSPVEFEGQSISVTASFGVAVCLVHTEDAIRDCIGQADAALYTAKDGGRNRVVTWEQVLRERGSTIQPPARPAGRPAMRASAGTSTPAN
jgi:diguanylate cyclase (GGDEF)-like protein